MSHTVHGGGEIRKHGNHTIKILIPCIIKRKLKRCGGRAGTSDVLIICNRPHRKILWVPTVAVMTLARHNINGGWLRRG